MKESDKTQGQLMSELAQLRQRVAELEASKSERKQTKEVVESTQERLATVIQAVAIPAFVVDKRHTVISWNTALEALSGIAGQDVVGTGRQWLAFYPRERPVMADLVVDRASENEMREYYRGKYKESALIEGAYEAEDFFPSLGEEGKWLRFTAAPVKDEAGRLIAAVETLEDITERRWAEEALRESQQRLRSIFEHTHDGIALVDEQGTIIDWSQGQERITGLKRDEVIGQPAWEVMPRLVPEDQGGVVTPEQMKAQAQQMLSEGPSPQRSLRQDVTIQRPDGTLGTFEEMTFPIETEKGFMVGVICRDITERKQAEEALQRSEHNYRALFDTALEGVTVINGETFKVALCNQNAARIFGFSSPEDAIGFDPLEAVHPDDRERTATIMLEDGFEKDLRETNEFRLITTDGRELWVSAVGAVTEYQGKQAMITSFTDITDRKRAEEVLRQSEERYRTILDDMEGGYYEVDIAGNCTFVNDAMCRHLGYSKQETIGMNNRAYMDEENAKLVYKTYNKVYRSGKPAKWLSWELIRKNGERRFVEISVYPLSNEAGEIIGFRGICNDITERKQAAEALRESEERYRTILEEMEEGYHELDLAGNFTFFNDSMCRMLGYSRKEMMGMDYRAYTPPEDVKAVFKDYNRVYRTGKPMKALSYKTIRKDGSAAFAEFSVFPLRNKDGEVVGFRGIRRDITERKRMEEALRQSEERYRTVLDEMEDSYFEVDVGGHITFANDATCRNLRLSREELMGASYKTFSAEKSIEDVYKAFNKAYRTGKPVKSFSWEIVRGDGSTGFAETTVLPLHNQDGQIIGFRGIGRDITERKHAEEALRESEEKYRDLTENISDTIYAVDEDGNVTYVSPVIESCLGYSPSEIIGRSFAEFLHQEDLPRAAERFQCVLSGQTTAEEYRFQTKSGEMRWMFTSNRPIFDGDRVVGARGVLTDISERKQAEQALLLERAKLTSILDAMEDGVYMVNQRHDIEYVNPSLQSQFGPVNGRKCYQYFHDLQDVCPWCQNKAVFAGETVRWEWYSFKNQRTYDLIDTPLKNADGTISKLEIFRDITERKRLEEEKKDLEQKAQMESRLASLGLLASGIGHEINNPLTGVIGYAQLLLGRDTPENIKKDLRAINEGAQRVANIVKRLVAFARHQKPQRTYAGISDMVAATVDLLAHQLETSNIEVTTHLDPNLPWTIADIGQLQQVFLNIIVNAETEMRLAHGKGELSIKTEKTDNTIRISFQDNGPGIAKENLGEIFDPFFTTREVGEGTGLGLSICHSIMTEHGGSIYAQSKPGKGATFIVELPVIAEDKHPKAAKPVAEEPPKVATARVLVVDDEQLILHFVSQVLTDEGHQVDTVDNAADALRKIESERYSLILLDIKMPGMSGIELYNHLKKRAQSLARRVVFITGDVMGAETTASLSRIKAPRIDKPFDAEQLKAQINRILARGES